MRILLFSEITLFKYNVSTILSPIVAQRWIKQDRDQSKRIKIELKSKRLQRRLIKQCEKGWGIHWYFDWPIPVFIRSFIRKNHEYTESKHWKIIKGRYMVLRGKVWLLRKIQRKIDKDYIMIIVRHVLFTPRGSNHCAIFIFSRCLIGLCSSLFDLNSNSKKVEQLGELRCIVSSKQGYTTSALETTCFSSGNAKHDIIYRGWKREVSAYQKWCNFCGSEDLSFKTAAKSKSFVFCRSNKNKNNKDSWFVLNVKIQCFY